MFFFKILGQQSTMVRNCEGKGRQFSLIKNFKKSLIFLFIILNKGYSPIIFYKERKPNFLNEKMAHTKKKSVHVFVNKCAWFWETSSLYHGKKFMFSWTCFMISRTTSLHGMVSWTKCSRNHERSCFCSWHESAP